MRPPLRPLAKSLHNELFKVIERYRDRDVDSGTLLASMALARAIGTVDPHQGVLGEPPRDESPGRHRLEEAIRRLTPDPIVRDDIVAGMNEILSSARSVDLQQVVRDLLDQDPLSRRRSSINPDPAVIQLMTQLLGEHPASLCDPDCGNGFLLATSAVRLRERGSAPARVVGVTTTERDASLCTVVGFLIGEEVDAHVEAANGAIDRAYEAIVTAVRETNVKGTEHSNGTDESKTDPDPKVMRKGTNAWVLAHRAHSMLAPGGRAVLLLPTRVALSVAGAAGESRRRLIEAGAVAAVLELPPLPWSGTRPGRGAIVLLERAASTNAAPCITFVRRAGDGTRPEDDAASDRLDVEFMGALVDSVTHPPAVDGRAERDGVVSARVPCARILGEDDDRLDPSRWVPRAPAVSVRDALRELKGEEEKEAAAARRAGEAIAKCQELMARGTRGNRSEDDA